MHQYILLARVGMLPANQAASRVSAPGGQQGDGLLTLGRGPNRTPAPRYLGHDGAVADGAGGVTSWYPISSYWTSDTAESSLALRFSASRSIYAEV